MKKMLAAVTALCLFSALAASCGGSGQRQAQPTASPTTAPTTAPTATPVPTVEPMPSPEPEPEDLSVKEGDFLYRINCGGEDLGEFVKDYKYWAGSFTASQTKSESEEELAEFVRIPEGMENAAPMFVYDSCRWVGANFFGYRFDGLEPGRAYTIRMHFIGMLPESIIPIIDVRINGEIVMEGFDMNEWVDELFVPIIKEITAEADEDGKIEIDFVHKKGNAVWLNAIEVIAGAPL